MQNNFLICICKLLLPLWYYQKLGKLYQPPHLVNDFNVDGLDYPESKACQYAKGHSALSKRLRLTIMQNRNMVLNPIIRYMYLNMHQPCYSIRTKCFQLWYVLKGIMKCHIGSTDCITVQFGKSAIFHASARSSFWEAALLLDAIYYLKLMSDRPKLPWSLTLRVMHLIQELWWSHRQPGVHPWFGRGGGGLGAERGRNDHGSRRGDVAQWAAVAVRYKAYDRCFSWKCITAPSAKSLWSVGRKCFIRIPEAFAIVNMHSFLLPAPKYLHAPFTFRQTYPGCHACTHTIKACRSHTPPTSLCPPRNHSYSQ